MNQNSESAVNCRSCPESTFRCSPLAPESPTHPRLTQISEISPTSSALRSWTHFTLSIPTAEEPQNRNCMISTATSCHFVCRARQSRKCTIPISVFLGFLLPAIRFHSFIGPSTRFYFSSFWPFTWILESAFCLQILTAGSFI